MMGLETLANQIARQSERNSTYIEIGYKNSKNSLTSYSYQTQAKVPRNPYLHY
jgi:hypothetical protein